MPEAPPATLAVRIALSAVLWIALSGKLDVVHLGFGATSIGLVLWLTRDLTLAQTLTARRRPLGRPRLGAAIRYPFWLLKEIAIANVSIARLILDPRLPIDPVVVRFDSRLESSLAHVLLGNSITLTPGTFTMDVRDGIFTVHALTAGGASATALGAMRARVANVFGEDEAATVPVLDLRRGDEVHTT